MNMVTKSRKRSRKTSDLANFEIVGIEVKGIPSVRVINQPILAPTPKPKPEAPPPPPPPPPPPSK
jgi:hypothetical protein